MRERKREKEGKRESRDARRGGGGRGKRDIETEESKIVSGDAG